jgi:hypothetical protein
MCCRVHFSPFFLKFTLSQNTGHENTSGSSPKPDFDNMSMNLLCQFVRDQIVAAWGQYELNLYFQLVLTASV